MFFILSKILFFLLVPIWWIVALFIWVKLSKSPKVKKRVPILILVILVVFSNPFFYRSMVSLWQPEPVTLPISKAYEAGVLLGGLSGYDKYNRGYFGNNADRFIQTANLYHQGFIKKIIISGGTGKLNQEGPAEASFLLKEFIKNGIPEKDLILETRSRNTYENGIYSKKVLDSFELKPPFILITSALHMKRSLSVFNKIGYSFVAFPCDYKVTPLKTDIGDFLVPDFSLLSEWSYFIKEIVGLYVYKLTNKA